MILEDFGCLLNDNVRSRAYIQKLVAHELLPAEVLLVRLTPSEPAQCNTSTLEGAIRQTFRERPYFLYSRSPFAVAPRSDQPPRQFRSFDPDESVAQTLARARLPYQTLSATSLNDMEVVKAVAGIRPHFLLFSGGSILKKPILNLGKRFIHIHPGIVPAVKGSMAVEWSLLLGQPCGASAFFMSEAIDEGEIIKTKVFPAPGIEFNGIPELYSPHIR